MKLFIATPSPFARKARVTLLEKQIPHEVIIDNPWQPESRIKDLNPLAKIPTLLLDDGRVIHDSKVIFEYLELERPGHLPDDKHAKIAHKLAEVVADGICDAIVMIFLENQRPEGSRSQFWLSRQADKIRAGVHELTEALRATDATHLISADGSHSSGSACESIICRVRARSLTLSNRCRSKMSVSALGK